MRILMLVKNTFTHDARVMRECETLTQSGHQVQVICLSGPGLPSKEIKSGVEAFRVNRGLGNKLRYLSDARSQASEKGVLKKKVIAYLINTTRRIGNLAIREIYEKQINRRMYKIALSLNPDVVHAHDLDTLAVGCKLKQHNKIPLIYDSHEMATGRNLASKRRQRRALQSESKLISCADRIIMAAEGYADRAIDLYGISNPTILLNVPNEIEPFDSNAFNLRTKFNIPQNHLLLVHLGILLPNRGIEQAIYAIQNLSNVSLVILGYGQHRPFLENLVTKLNLIDRVKFLGPLNPEDLIRWSSSADLGLCTIVGESDSYKHSMPNKLFEYFMAGIPVITSNYVGMGSFVEKYDVGFTVNPYLVSALSALIKSIDVSALQGYQANVKLVSAKFNWQNEQKKLIDVYKDLIPKAS